MQLLKGEGSVGTIVRAVFDSEILGTTFLSGIHIFSHIVHNKCVLSAYPVVVVREPTGINQTWFLPHSRVT